MTTRRNMKRLLATLAGLLLLSFLIAGSAGASTTYQWGQQHNPANGAGGPLYRSPVPVTVPGTVSQVVDTNTDDYALSGGTVYAWGEADQGELGAGSTGSGFDETPTQVQFPAGVVIASLTSTGPDGTMLAIDTNGNLWGWGYNNHHQLCTSTQRISTPVELPFTDVTAAAGAGDHTIVEAGGTLYACGTNDNGDLGIGATGVHNGVNPVVITGLPSSVVAVRASYHNSGVLLADGSVWMWGLGTGGQLGDGSFSNSNVPVKVSLSGPVTQLSVGGSLANNGQTIVQLADGSVWTWGTDQDGQLGDGGTTAQDTPEEVNQPVPFSLVDSGGSAEYAIGDGQVYAWGDNSAGQLGTGAKKGAKVFGPTSIGLSATEVSSTAFNVIAR